MSDFNAKMHQIRFPLQTDLRRILLKGGRRKWREGEGWRVEEKMRPLLLRKGKKEVDRREERGGKGRGRDLPDQCQSASYIGYAPVYSLLGWLDVKHCNEI